MSTTERTPEAGTLSRFALDAQHHRSQPTAPVPDIAKGHAVPQAGYVLDEIADGIFWIGDGSYQTMFVVTDEGVIAVDAPPTLGGNILRAIDRVTTKPVTHVVYSHHHSDHCGAMSIYPDSAIRYAQRATAQRLEILRDPHRPLPTKLFDDGTTIDAGDHSLELTYPGPNHSEGNSFIHAPNPRVLMLVDVVFPGWVPFSNLALSAFVPGYIEVTRRALEFDFDHLVSGHVTRPGTPEDVRVQLDYLMDLRLTAESALSSVDLSATMAPVDTGNAWAVFRAYLDAVAAETADELVPRWKDRLGGADVFTLPNAWAMAEALRLDFNSLGPFGTTP
jgi:glyoxylase-like metal-dependent hydrolase (beta-lactamase superfamily II)